MVSLYYRAQRIAKVVFSQACVCPQGRGGRGASGPGGCLLGGVCSRGGGLSGPGGAWSGGLVSQHALRQTPPPGETATAADGTHPTGMHSCFKLNTGSFITLLAKTIRGQQSLVAYPQGHM